MEDYDTVLVENEEKEENNDSVGCKENCENDSIGCKENCENDSIGCKEETNKVFVISIDDEPFFFTKTEDDAQDKILDIAEDICDNDDWVYYIKAIDYNIVKITRIYKYYTISYEQIFKIIRYDEIEEI